MYVCTCMCMCGGEKKVNLSSYTKKLLIAHAHDSRTHMNHILWLQLAAVFSYKFSSLQQQSGVTRY